MKTGSAGRADLLEAYLAGGPEIQSAMARLLGMELVIPEPIAITQEIRSAAAAAIREPSPPPRVEIETPFWRAETYARLESPLEGSETAGEELSEAADRPPPKPLAFRPLASAAAVVTKLRRVASFGRASGELDVAKVVAHLSRVRVPSSLPRRTRKTLGQSIYVIIDKHEHLKPYFVDQFEVLHTLYRLYPRGGVKVVYLQNWATRPGRRRTPTAAAYPPPEPGAAVLALSDLGALALGQSVPRETWLALGKLYRQRGERPIALVPCDIACIPVELTSDWIVIPWESRVASRAAGLGPDQVEEVSRRVLTLLSYALRLEPVLIREVRRLLVKGRLGAGVEARVWQDPTLRCQEFEAAEFVPGKARQRQQFFERELPEVRCEIVSLLRRAHLEDYEFVWFLERLNLEAETRALETWALETRALDPKGDDLSAAVRWARSQESALEGSAGRRAPASDASLWFRRALARLPESTFSGSAGDALHKIWALTSASSDHPPTGLDPARVPALGRSLRTLEIRQVANRLVARPPTGGLGSSHSPGSPLALIRTRNGLIKLDDPEDFWAGGEPPPWADDWGWDAVGAWVTIRVENVTQRLRWIPAGTFWMGSPQDEEGRFADEGPRGEKTVRMGFWMFDTPCTQALWKAVMVENRSHFQGDDCPVERVSWDECQEFIKRLNEKCDGLQLALPTETQWEYACRAGTKTPRYRKNLDDIAWYSENSRGTTHPVGQKAPNDWGLYDTLGNIFEWCENTWSDDYGGKSRAMEFAPRVIRGGSWSNVAQYVSAAYRSHYGPSQRLSRLGFRCAEFKSGCDLSARNAAGWRADAKRRAAFGATRDRDRANGAGILRLDAEGKKGLVFAAVTPRRICTDVEEIVLGTTTLPSWASAMGRDRYGLWAEFTIDRPVENQAPAQNPPSMLEELFGRLSLVPQSAPSPRLFPTPIRQRFRWIPPGRFLMGSPRDEEGRFDWEQPPHEVAIEDGFWMFQTPCTQALWEAVTGKNPSRFKGPARPVESVSWQQCQEFVKALNARLAGLQLSLPSEAQWEYACRAGATTPCHHDNLDEIAWYGENSKGETHPVGDTQANSWGLRDMLGNVWEWCNDVWVGGDDRSSTSSAHRVIRGGSWNAVARHVRAANRHRYEPTDRVSSVGFRCAEFRSGRELGPRSDA